MSELCEFEYPDIFFFAVKDSVEDDYSIEEGVDFIYLDPDELTENELLEWANDRGYLEVDAGFKNTEGTIDLAGLNDAHHEEYRLHQEEYPEPANVPQGRAFEWFENQEFEFPSGINIRLIESGSPASNWQYVVVNGYYSLVTLQLFFLEKGLEVNFYIVEG